MSYSDLNEKQKNRLDEQQRAIIESKSKKIFVSAGPGSGKTYTISKKIMNDINDSNDYQGVIACSFTKEAAREISNRVTNLVNVDTSIIATLDSFVLSEIITPFINRYLSFVLGVKYKQVEKIKVKFPKGKHNMDYINQLTRNYDFNKNWKENPDIHKYVSEWFNDFKKGIYEISFPSYIVATSFVQQLDIISEFIKSKFTTIYVDEAQDLNGFQHMFLNTCICQPIIDPTYRFEIDPSLLT